MNSDSTPVSLKDKLNGYGLFFLSQIVRKTCKLNIINSKYLESALKEERPVIIAGWHGVTMMAVPMIQRFLPDLSSFVLLMPDDWRGTALRIWAEKLKANPYPMNLSGDSTLGMAKKVARLTKRVSEGQNMYITPDGPDGPSHVIKPGLDYIARKSNAIIIPLGAYCRNAYIVPRWDRYAVPLPFSKIACHIGEPIDKLPDDAAEAELMITNTLNRVTLQASADFYEHDNPKTTH